jgi:hypothetical protein
MGNILDMTIAAGWTSGQQNGRHNYCHFAGKMAEHKTGERQKIDQEDIRKQNGGKKNCRILARRRAGCTTR